RWNVARKSPIKPVSRRFSQCRCYLFTCWHRRWPFLENQIVKHLPAPGYDFAACLIEFDHGLTVDLIVREPGAIYRRGLSHERLAARRVNVDAQEKLFISQSDFIRQAYPTPPNHHAPPTSRLAPSRDPIRISRQQR